MKILATEQNVANLDALLEHVLTDVINGKIKKDDAKAGLAELIHCIDNDSVDGAELWLAQGRKLMRNSNIES